MLFTTARTLVRHFVASDLDDLAALCANPAVMRWMGDGTTLSREAVAHWIEVCQVKYRDRGYGTSAVFEQSSGRFMGFCGVVRAPERPIDELIYAFAPPYWGQGYATEVARAMLDDVFARSTLAAIYATIDARNAASLHVARKLGFGLVTSELENDGSTSLVYSLARP